MDADLTAKAIEELRSAWPYQEIPDTHLRHWRDVLGMYSRDVVRKVMFDAKTTRTGRPTWGEFGDLCNQLSAVLAKAQRQGPYLDESVPPLTAVPPEVRAAHRAGVEEFARARRQRIDAARSEVQAKR